LTPPVFLIGAGDLPPSLPHPSLQTFIMGLLDFVLNLLGFSRKPDSVDQGAAPASRTPSSTATNEPFRSVLESPAPEAAGKSKAPGNQKKSGSSLPRKPQLKPLPKLRYQSNLIATPVSQEVCEGKPYRFAWSGSHPGEFLNLSQDCDQRWLDYFGLPVLKTPDDLAQWLGIPIGKLAWLTHRTLRGQRAENVKQSHYSYRWLTKKSGGHRLIEAPKCELKRVQEQILRELLDHVPPHTAAHGFVTGRSIVTNAEPHVGQRLVLKFDLQNFYTNISYSRVVAIFRSLGYSREVALWLGRLTTTSIPWNLNTPLKSWELTPYAARHLPQGAPTSPALANLSAFGLDVRLTGLAHAYELEYTRYADDLTFSGPGVVIPALSEIIPLVEKVIHAERFLSRKSKRRVLRGSSRQSVAGVVVNEKLNVARSEYDRLKAILHNCRKHGPSTQKRDLECDFSSHLLGRIAHVRQLNPRRAEKLQTIFSQINWSR